MEGPRKNEKTERRKKPEGLLRDTRGAVLAEFVVAIFPLLTIFFVFLQLSAIAAATLIVKHSAVIGARAASVLSNKNNNIPEAKGNGQADIETGVRNAMGPWANKMSSITVSVADQSSRNKDHGAYDLVTVRVTATFRCNVPLGRAICPGGVKIITDTKSMPHQGARYKL